MPPRAGQIGTAISAGLAGATGGASLPIELILGLIGGGSGLMSLFSGESPQDEATKYALEQMKKYLPELSKSAYSKGEVGNLVSQFKQGIGTSTDIAKTGIATSLAEGMGAAGVPQGQAQGSMYTSELAPLDATAVREKAGADKWGAEFWASLDSEAKNRTIAALNGLTGTAMAQPGMTGTEKSMATFLQAFNLLSKGGGNLASMFKDLNWKPLNV
jgi:hypothetical protein